MNLLFVDSGSFKVYYGPVVFPVSGFPRKNLGVDLCDCLYYLVDCLILFLIAQKGKRIV